MHAMRFRCCLGGENGAGKQAEGRGGAKEQEKARMAVVMKKKRTKVLLGCVGDCRVDGEQHFEWREG